MDDSGQVRHDALDGPVTAGPRCSAGDLERFTRDLLQALGTPADIAGTVSSHLVGSNLAGHDSHGVMRLMRYVDEIRRGDLVPAARPALLRSSAVTALFDAGRGFGHHSTRQVMGWCIDRAAEHGIAAAAVRHSTHIGRLGEYTEAAAARGLVGLVTVGVAGRGVGRVAAFGGTSAFLGTNPWSIAVPAGERPPMVFDAATSAIAEGKARVALARDEPLPPETLIDRSGVPSRYAGDLYEGGLLLPLGGVTAGHKGYGLALAAALVGGLAMIGDETPTLAGTAAAPREPVPWLGGVVAVAIDPEHFGGASAYAELVTAVLGGLDGSGPLVPGEPERRSRSARARDGIPLPLPTLEALRRLAQQHGVEPPATM